MCIIYFNIIDNKHWFFAFIFNEVATERTCIEPFTTEIEDKIIESLRPTYISGLTILGGEPMEVPNQAVLRPFIERIKRELPNKTIWIYSGYLLEELMDEDNKRCHSSDTMKILDAIDILVDGEFVEALKDIMLRFRGSSNQRIIDVPETLRQGEIVLSKYNEKNIM